jgi:ligand-binding sensor domain-containing protein
MKKLLYLIILLLAGTYSATSQTFDFKVYNSSIGLPQNYVYAVKQDHNGFIWVATAEGVSRYDGISFKNYTDRDSLADIFTRSIYINQDDDRILFGHNNGSLSVYNGKEFKKIVIEEALSPIRAICPASNNSFWALEQNNGLIKIDSDYNTKIYFDRKKFGRLIYTDIQKVSESVLLVGTTDGLCEIILSDEGEPESLNFVDQAPLSPVNCISPSNISDKEFWIGTEDQGFYKYNSDTKKVSFYNEDISCVEHKLNVENIQSIRENNDGCLFLGTWGRGVMKLHYNPTSDKFDYSQTFSQENGMANNYIKDILLDRENNLWFATYGGGVASLLNDYFSFYNFEEIGLKYTPARTVLRDETGLWLGLDNALLHANPHCFTEHEYYDAAQGLPSDQVTGLYSNDGVLWVATANRGLFRKSSTQRTFTRVHYTNDIPGLKINAITGDGEKVYLATQGGFFVIDIKDGKTSAFNTENGLPHNSINFVCIDKQNQVWLGPKDSGITLFKKNSFEIHRLADSPVNVSDMTVDHNNRLWLSTFNRGILCYTADTIINYTVQEGLEKNYCYAIECDSRNRIWVAHQPGATCFNIEKGTFRRFGLTSQLNTNFFDIFKDESGDLWFGTSQGTVCYNPLLDSENQYPPLLNFIKINISGVDYLKDQKISLPYRYNKRPYLFNIDFVGISHKDPQNVSYEYSLSKDNSTDDQEWIPLNNIGHKELDYLSDGKYTFMVRAFNGDGVMSITPLELSFKIEAPVWKKSWFYLVVVLLLMFFVVFLIRTREKRLKQQKKLLEKEVANQTVVLRKQKAEIEQKNRDITDSINYAQRIQKSILPPLANLQNTFKESFIYFKPRDIVSGDFYWFSRNDETAVICCADCTGHGVPGAFMSMIGTTILNDIFRLPEIDSPASLLERLDSEMKILLHRHNDIETNDGMDIAVVEIHLPTRRIRIASAKRPVYLFLNGQFTEYKGNRRSIGDKSANQTNNPFNNIVYSGQKGDLIYLFSDGYSDQFGGINGKKMMTTGVKDLISNMIRIPMKEQEIMVANHFSDWKGDLDQIDDVLFLGIKIP